MLREGEREESDFTLQRTKERWMSKDAGYTLVSDGIRNEQNEFATK